jgi:apolipoprotein D and lipocalin family protein
MKWLFCSLWLFGCATVPEGLHPVSGFEINRFAGKWYEIERLDNPNEFGLSNVSGEYLILPNGKIEVTNRGFNIRRNSWSQVKGVAWFTGSKDIGSLKLSFGTPFPGTYNVLVLDPQYRYAMVTGTDIDHLWILSREPQLDRSIVDSLVAKAKSWGFDTNRLVFDEQKAMEQQN